MEFNLSLSALVNAAGAFLFLVVGLAILVVGRASPRGVWIGLLASAFGWTFVVENLLDYSLRGTGEAWIVGASMGVTSVLALKVTADLARDCSPRARGWLTALSIVSAIGAAAAVVIVRSDPGLRANVAVVDAPAGTLVFAARVALETALTLLIVAGAMRFQAAAPDAPNERRAIASLTVAFGLFTMFWVCGNAIAPIGVGDPQAVALFSLAFLLGLLGVAGATMFVIPAGPEPRLARSVFGALLLGGFLSALALLGTGPDFEAASAGFGLFGILRTIGVVFLARAVLRYDLLGVPLPHLAGRRGTLAAGALATLFIAAQVAQNFFGAKYGLVTGGIVAGAFLFAAQPLQRAMENVLSARPSKGVALTPTGAAFDRVAENERVYALALKKFGADGRITADEELALAHLADTLGLTTRRATELRLALSRPKRKT